MPVIPDTIWPYSFHRSDLAANLRRTKLNAIFFAANIKTARLSPIFHTFRTLGPRRLYRRDICPCIGREYRGGGWAGTPTRRQACLLFIPLTLLLLAGTSGGKAEWKTKN